MRAERPTRRALLTQALGAGAATSALAAWPAESAQEPAPQQLAALAGLAEDYLDTYGVPGLSVAFGRSGDLLHAAGYGHADDRTAVDPRSLFRIASVSKPITSVAIFTLAEAGRLRLTDRPFGPSGVLRDFAPRNAPFLPEITVEHLLTHTTGGWPNDGDDPMFEHLELSQAELIRWTLAERPLTEPPGLRHLYSNFGYCLLGRVIERASGLPYADYVRSAVLNRCAIADMRIAGDTRRERVRGEVAYYPGERPYRMDVARMDSHGGWIATASDLVRFAMRVDGRAPGGTLLNPASVHAMTTPLPVSPHYACGWAIKGGTWWHSGSLPGTASILVRTPSGLCWAALANARRRGSGTALDQLMWRMARSIEAEQP